MTTDRLFARLLGASLILLLSGLPDAAVAMTGQQAAGQQPVTQSKPATDPVTPSVATSELPDSPGAVRLQAAQEQAPLQQGQTQQAQPQPQQAPPWSPVAKPAGTAAAEMTNTGGATASEPAGVAIAPAKQRRVRAILIKMGAILGAGAALGTVIGLSQASGSKPPGSQ